MDDSCKQINRYTIDLGYVILFSEQIGIKYNILDWHVGL